MSERADDTTTTHRNGGREVLASMRSRRMRKSVSDR